MLLAVEWLPSSSGLRPCLPFLKDQGFCCCPLTAIWSWKEDESPQCLLWVPHGNQGWLLQSLPAGLLTWGVGYCPLAAAIGHGRSRKTMVNPNSTSWFSWFVYSSSWGHSIIYQPLVQRIHASWRAESKSHNICSLNWHLIWVFNSHSFISHSWPIKPDLCDFPCSFLFCLLDRKQGSDFRRYMLNMVKPQNGRNWNITWRWSLHN